MITIIHGEDITASRKYFTDTKGKRADVVSFDGVSLTLTDLTQVVDGGDLFGAEKTVYVENFLSKRKPGKEFDEIVVLLNKTNFDVFFWEGKELTKKQVSSLSNATVKLYTFPKTVFAFLDNLRPNNTKNMLAFYHQTLESSEAELIFFLLIRQFRLLLGLSSSGGEQIDEVKRLAPWQKSKLIKQAGYFSKDQIITLYKKLYTLDLDTKTGNLSMPLSQAIDFFLLEL